MSEKVSGNQPAENTEGFPVYYCAKYRENVNRPASDHPAGEWTEIAGNGIQMMFWCPGDHVAAMARERDEG